MATASIRCSGVPGGDMEPWEEREASSGQRELVWEACVRHGGERMAGKLQHLGRVGRDARDEWGVLRTGSGALDLRQRLDLMSGSVGRPSRPVRRRGAREEAAHGLPLRSAASHSPKSGMRGVALKAAFFPIGSYAGAGWGDLGEVFTRQVGNPSCRQ